MPLTQRKPHYRSGLGHMNHGVIFPVAVDTAATGRDGLKGFGQASVSVRQLDTDDNIWLCIDQAIARRSRHAPKNEAICAWDAEWTYEELEDLSARIANRLIALGIGPESLVPFCFEKSAWAIVAILGILKAGGAFVPLDPTHPVDRLRNIINESRAQIILSSAQNEKLCRGLAHDVVVVSASVVQELPVQVTNKSRAVRDNAAYVIFTSGSTGRPKGCIVEHQAFSSCALAHGPAHRIRASSRVLQFASYSFDACLVEILTTLIFGGVICIPSAEARLNDLASFMNKARVNLAILTPSVASLLKPKDLPLLDTLVLVGEPIKKSHVSMWTTTPNLICAYGPTETAVSATVNPKLHADSPANIGRPVGCRIQIVEPEDHNKLVVPGDVGELLIIGSNLARGYLNDPVKTAASFVEVSEERAYKTGDLVRETPGGSLEFVARKDTQIKINGQRVELGEIEECIQSSRAGAASLVLLPMDGLYKGRLVAVVRFEPGSGRAPYDKAGSNILQGASLSGVQPALLSIKEHLARSLPSFMCPSLIIPVWEIPLLASGKIDRNGVTRWIETLDETTTAEIDPAIGIQGAQSGTLSAIERLLLSVWSEVLSIPVERINPNQTFISLGGDSISAMQIRALCRARGVTTNVHDILRFKTIAKIAPHVKQLAATVFELEPDDGKPFDLSPIQQMLFEAAPYGENHFNQSFLLESVEIINPDKLRKALDLIVERHDMLRARFHIGEAGHWKQSVSPEVSTSYHLSYYQVSTRKAMEAMVEEAQEMLDICNGPVVVFQLFHFDRNSFLSMTVHHAIFDLVSWRVIVKELENILRRPNFSFQNSTLSFRHWLKLQQSFGEMHLDPCNAYNLNLPASNLSFWAMDAQPNLHIDKIKSSFVLDARSSGFLLRDGPRVTRADTNEILLASLMCSFAKVFPDRNIPAAYVEGHGREAWDASIDITETVGWFTTLYPVPVEVETGHDIVDVIRHIKDAHRSVPRNGWSYFTSRYLNAQGRNAFKIEGPMEIVFNFSGSYQQLEGSASFFQQVPWSTRESVAGRMKRFSLFEISVDVSYDRLGCTFVWNSKMAHQARISEWIDSFHLLLNNLSAEISGTVKHLYSPSDFPYARLNCGSLEDLVSRILPGLRIDFGEDIDDLYICTPLQQGILLSQAKKPSLYFTETIWMVEMAARTQIIDTGRIATAWEAVVARHASLRTIFIEQNASEVTFLQAVLKSPRILVTYEIWDGPGPPRPGAASSTVTFKPGDPLHNFTIYQGGGDKVFCSLKISHALMDGQSIDNIVHDILQAYDGKLPGQPPMVFEEYITFVQEQPKAPSLQYWKARLYGTEPCHLPKLNRNASSHQRRMPQALRSIIEESDASCLWNFCDIYGITMSTLVHLSWSVVLQAFTGSSDVLFGYPASGRDVPIQGIDGAVGAFANLLVCRIKLDSTSTIIDTLNSLQLQMTMDREHQFLPLADIQHALAMPQPLFNSILSYQKHEISRVATKSSIEFEKMGEWDPSEYDVALGLHEFDRRLFVKMGYLSDLLSTDQASQVLESFQAVLVSITKSPTQPLSSIDLLSTKARERAVEMAGLEGVRVEETIHSVFLSRAKTHPDDQAVDAWDAQWTYLELLNFSYAFAQDVSNLGVSAGAVVPICFEKSAWTIVAMIGVLMAGGAFVLLDVTQPAARLQIIIDQVSPRLIISSQSQELLAQRLSKNVYLLDPGSLIGTKTQDIAEPSSAAANPNDTAFIIFTSGSTGKPKGVILSHSAFVSAARAHASPLKLSSASRVLQFASYSFDACLLEILTTLLVGGTVCIPSESDRSSDLARVIKDMRITWANLTPLVADLLLEDDLPRLQTIVVAGETMSSESIRRWRQSSIKVINGYGPTEACVAATLNHDFVELQDISNIGRPVGCRSWIMNEYQQAVPMGAVGELILEGPTLAVGYLGDTEKTEAAFIKPPIWLPTSSERVYKTGDLVRYELDGSIKFVGRKDASQVKIRGQRVELDAVRHEICKILDRRFQCLVEFTIVAKLRRRVLIAFFTESPSTETSSLCTLENGEQLMNRLEHVRETVRISLPTYMVPELYIPLTNIPLMPSGKLDRRLLHDMAKSLTSLQLRSYSLTRDSGPVEAPSSPMEKTLANMWAQLIKIQEDEISRQSDFFRIGADSVAAMKLTSLARNHGMILTVAEVFANPRLSQMAAALEINHKRRAVAENDDIPFSLLNDDHGLHDTIAAARSTAAHQCGVSASQILDAYPCSPQQESLFATAIRHPGSYITEHTIRLPQDIDIPRFKKACEAVYASADILRTRIFLLKAQMLQVVIDEPLTWEASEKETGTPTLVDFGAHLSTFALAKAEDERYVFKLAMHHAIYDGWSLQLLFNNIEQLYRGGTQTSLVQYKNFIAYIAKSRRSDEGQYWRAQLRVISPSQFPSTTLTGPYHLQTRHRVRCELPESLHITKSVLIRAAWTLTISHLTTSNDIVFGAVLSGRNAPVVSAMEVVGPMVATVPICVSLKRDQPVSDLLDQIQRQATDMIMHEHTGLQKLRQLAVMKEATNFASLLVVQSVESGLDTFKFLDSDIMPDETANVDVYPLILEVAPDDEFHINITARFDPAVVPESDMESILQILQDVLLQLCDQRTTMSVGDVMSYLELYHELQQKKGVSHHDNDQSSKADGTTLMERHPAQQSVYVKPLQELWAMVLEIPLGRVDWRSNFFHLGGDSIAAIKLTMAARSIKLVLSVATIFSSPILVDMALLVQPVSVIQQETPTDLAAFSLLEITQHSSLETVIQSCADQCNVNISEIEDIYPCTPLQEGLLALSQKQLGAYVAQHIWRVPGTINHTAFTNAWEAVSLHRGILRTRIIVHESKMLQTLVKTHVHVEHSIVQDPLKLMQKVTFSPELGDSLARFLLLDGGEDNTFFIFLAHHAIFDAWTLPLLFQDVGKLYKNQTIAMPVPFKSFVHHVMKRDVESNRDFWRGYFNKLDVIHFPKPLTETYTSDTTIHKVSSQVTLRHNLQFNVTTATLLRAAWALTLSHYANTEDVVFWSTLGGRDTDLAGITEVDGPTLATIPIRTKAKRDHSVYRFLTTAQDDLNSIAPFQNFGIQNIRQVSDDALKACDATSHLMIQAGEGAGTNWLGLEQADPQLANYTSYPLALDCRINGDNVNIAAYANPSALSRIETERVIEHFTYAIGKLSRSGPDHLLGDIEKTSSHDGTTLKAWNKHVPKTIHRTIHEVIHGRAKEFADRPAVCAWDAEWTHGQLDKISNRLALQLKEAGVTPESIVPVCFERSAWMVVAMLAVLKAGGAFLPWDPAHPEERRIEMVRQIDCSIILTTRKNADICAGLCMTLVIVDPAALESTDTPSLEPHDFHRDCASSAYLIYTSGSTGRPKGVVITHEAYSSSGLEHGPVHHIGPTSRVLQFASYSVDAICLEILTTLMMGGCTCIPSLLDRDNQLQQALRKMEVSVLALTPSVLSVLAPEELPSLKTCIMVGEPAPTALVERWAPCAHLINGYGPTETSLAAVMNQEMTVKTGANIGRAVGCATWIADPEDHDRLVPIGAVGELLIEGPTLARGYLHDQAKTDTAFILNPSWLCKPGTRLYKTGDLVKYADDGTIIFVGRKDTQVKVNGQRVELREIEHHIKKNMSTLDQVVVEASRSDDGRARKLVAFLTIKPACRAELGLLAESSDAIPATTPELERELKTLTRALVSFLPVYMMPTMWVPLNEIPVATSGKVDRKKLTELANTVVREKRSEHFLASSASRCAPETSMGVLLQDLWAEVLKIPTHDISADDSFFRVGGDSIAAMKLAGLASMRNLRLSVQSIFEYPMLRDMADHMEANSGQNAIAVSSSAPLSFSMVDWDGDVLRQAIHSRLADSTLEIEDVTPATDFQAWAVGFSILQPKGFVTYMILTPNKPFDRDRLSNAIQVIVKAIPILRTGFLLKDGKLLQVIFRDFAPELECHNSGTRNLTSAREEWLGRDSQQDVPMPHPLTQFTLLSNGSEDEQCLILRLSHAQYDGVSFPRVWESLHQAYSKTEIPTQPPYSAFVEAVHGVSQSQSTLDYWCTLLKGSSMTSFTSQPKSTYTYPLNKTRRCTIPWVAESQNQEFTQATIVKAAWTLVLSHLNSTQCDKVVEGVPPNVDLTFGSLVSGRSSSSILHNNAIGPYLNIIPVRVKVDLTTTLYELATFIQDQHTTSLPYENMGFREIIRSCTDWPSHTRFNSVVQHQNLPEITDQVKIGDIDCRSEAWRRDVDSSDIVVLSTPLGESKRCKDDRKLRLEIGYCSRILNEKEADALVQCLGKLAQMIISADSDSVRIGEILGTPELFLGVPNRPYHPSEHTCNNRLVNGDEVKADEVKVEGEDINLIEEELLILWRRILNLKDEQVSRDVPFSSYRGGDFVATCLLTETLRQRGYTGISVEKMLEEESLARQARMMLRLRKQNGSEEGA